MSAFDGYRVLDFSQGIPGPIATMLLADFNAEVIKIEPSGGDRMKDHPGYLAWNRNKKRLMLDLQSPADLESARGLLRTADVAVFDSAPGELESLGLDSDSLLEANPALLHVWLPTYSATGPWKYLPPDDALLSAVTGHSFLQFSYEDVPVWFVAPMVSYHYGLGAGAALVASLYERLQSGLGQSLVMTGLDALAICQGGSAIQAEGMTRMGANVPGARGGMANYRLYQCADGKWLFLGSLTEKFFLRALEALDLLDIMAHETISGDAAKLRFGPGAVVAIAELDKKFAEKPMAEWMQILEDADVPRAPAGNREEWFHGEVVAANEMRVELRDSDLGTVLVPGVSAKLARHPGSVRHLVEDVTVESLSAHSPVGLGSLGRRSGAGPLDGVNVLDLGGYIAGTFGPTVLAAYGANVVKVEGLDGDPFRFAGLSSIGHNQGKRSLSVDMKHSGGIAAVLELARQSDLVLDNFRKGVPERLGVDYDSLRAVNPDIITCSVTGYGWGPMAARPGFDPLVQAESGMMHAQGGELEPVFYQLPINDESTAIMNAFGMLTALVARERFGGGQKVETSLANQSVLLQSGEITWYEGRPPAPVGDRDYLGTSLVRRMYECSDGWIAVACRSEDEAGRFFRALGLRELRDAHNADELASQPADSPLARGAQGFLRECTREETLSALEGAGVPAAPVMRIEELGQSDWFADEDFFMETVHPEFGPLRSVSHYATWSRTPSAFPRGAPMAGEHSLEVLEEFGFASETAATLLEEGAILQWQPN